MELSALRNEIDRIDDQLVALFVKRMGISAQVAAYKSAHNLPILVPEREQAVLQAVAAKSGHELAEYTKALYSTIFQLSRDYQKTILDGTEVIP